MVFVWSNLSDGHPGFTLSQVALNDLIMVFAFAPIVALLLGISSIHVPWDTLILSVVLYIVLPVIVASLWRKWLTRGDKGDERLQAVLDRMHPVSLSALLITLVLLFGFQGKQIIAQPLIIVLLAIPILIQVYFNSGLAYLLNKKLGVEHCVAAPSALIGASNFFELAVAAAIAIFGLESGAALATVVGVLVEVPVMLSVVRIVNRSKAWYEKLDTPGSGLVDRHTHFHCCRAARRDVCNGELFLDLADPEMCDFGHALVEHFSGARITQNLDLPDGEGLAYRNAFAGAAVDVNLVPFDQHH